MSSERFLRTDHLQGELDSRSTRGGSLMMVSHAIQLLLGVGAVATLARVLKPADFGLVAMALILTDFLDSFRHFGLHVATVQRPEIDHRQFSRLFWTNAKLNLALAAAMVAMAPVLAWFFGEPPLVGIVLLLTIGTVVQGVTNMNLNLLFRQMRYPAIAVLEIGSLAAAAVVGIGLALAGAGFWALAFQHLTNLLFRAGVAWFASSWRPARPADSAGPDDEGVRSMLAYGKNVTLTRIVTYLGNRLDQILVGRLTGRATLGLYQNAYRWSVFPFLQIFRPMSPVAVASFSRLQSDPGRYRSYVQRALLVLFGVTLPAVAFFFVAANDVILLLLGEQWRGAVPLFRILSVAVFAGGLSMMTEWVYFAEGRTQRQLAWALVATPVLILGVLFGVPWGAVGVAIGYTAATLLLAAPAVMFCLRASPLQGKDVWAPWLRAALPAVIAAAGLWLLQPHLSTVGPRVLRLAAAGSLFAFTYALIWLATPAGRRDLRQMLNLAATLRP